MSRADMHQSTFSCRVGVCLLHPALRPEPGRLHVAGCTDMRRVGWHLDRGTQYPPTTISLSAVLTRTGVKLQPTFSWRSLLGQGRGAKAVKAGHRRTKEEVW